ncbi:MAG: hypothetical protein ACQES4_11220 [Bacillota bacterium]
MYYFKQGAKYLALALLMVLVFSMAAAGSSSNAEYILYERSDGNYILVNYEEALEYYTSGSLSGRRLYQEAVEDIQVALSNFRNVYVSTTINDSTVVIDYSQAVNDGKTFSQAADDYSSYEAPDDYDSLAKLYDEAFREMVLDGNTVVLQRPARDEAPDGIEIYVVYSELAASYFVNVKIDKADSDDITNLTNVDAVEILGRSATSRGVESGVNIWRIRLSYDPLDRLDVDELTTRHFRVMYNGSWLW